jgi:hypothetical protein
MAKRRVRSQTANLIINHYKSWIVPIYLCSGGVSHTVGKLSTRVTTLLWRSIQKVMGFQNHKNPNFENFETPNLGVLRQNDMWVQAPWPSTENTTIKGKVVASPKSRLWWVLWILVCSWLVYASKVFQLCINQLVVRFM